MSGGYFEYKQYDIGYMSDEVEQLIRTNLDETLNAWGDPNGRHYGPETIQRFEEAVKALRLAATYAQRIDWLVCGDDGEDTFHERLKAELERLG